MTMIQKRLVGLAALFVMGGVGLYLVYWQDRRTEQAQKSESAEQKVLRLEKFESIISVELTNSHGLFKLGKQQGEQKPNWRIETPKQVEADDTIVEGLLRQLSELKHKRIIGAKSGETVEPPVDQSLFGLAPPRFSVKITDKDGKTEALNIGKKNSFDGSLYAQVEGEKVVRSLDGSFEYQVDKDLFGLRNKKILKIDSRDVRQLVVTYRDEKQQHRYAFSKFGENFRVQEGSKAPGEKDGWAADEAQVQGILSGLTNLVATAFTVEQPQKSDLQGFGFLTPVVELDLKTANDATIHLQIGQTKTKEGPGKYYALVADGPLMEIAGESLVQKVAVDVVTFRDMKILAFARDDVKTLLLKKGDQQLTFEKKRDEKNERDEWNMTSPKAQKVQDAKLAGLLYRVSDLKAAHIVREGATDTDLKTFGLQPVVGQIEMSDAAGKVLATLLVGKIEGAQQYVSALGSARIDLIDASFFQEIAWDADSYKEETTASK